MGTIIALNIFEVMALKTLGHTGWLLAGFLVVVIGIIIVDAVVGNTTAKQVWLNRLVTTVLLGLLGIVVVVLYNRPIEHFYRVSAVPITRIGSVATDADGTEYRIVEYRLKGHTKRVRVPLKQIVVTDGRNPRHSLNDIQRGTIKAKLTLKPQYRADARRINAAFAKHLTPTASSDGYLNVKLVAPTHYHRLTEKG